VATGAKYGKRPCDSVIPPIRVWSAADTALGLIMVNASLNQ